MDTRSEVQRCITELGLQSYSRVDLMSFTSNFSESNKIGSGGYGDVYKGQLPKGVFIAVKVLKNMDIVEDTFMAEICTMGKARHRNLIKLYGFCFEDNVKALVYEYMDNGSLDKILYENNHGGIEWVKLYGIANDIANGLNYLHDGLEEQIIHYDIKAANVLLGKNFSAKLTDFGLAKIMNRDISHVDVSRIRGTRGYIAPEIWTPGSQVSYKCDVYSFGMMLFEILGKRSNGKEKDWFPLIVWKQFENGTLDQLIRDCGIIEKDRGKAIILSKVALCCAHHRPERRPSMKEVVSMLEEHLPVEEPSYPFLPGLFYNSSMVPSQKGFPRVSLEVPLARSKRKWVDSLERDPSAMVLSQEGFPQVSLEVPSARSERLLGDLLERDPAYPSTSYASITGGGNNGPEDDGGVTLRQHSLDILEKDLATMVQNQGKKLPTTKLVGETTALKYKEIILKWIAKDEVVTIGVHGMGGIGKTTIFKHVHNQILAEGKRFDKIIWVTVSKDGNIIKLQNDLAKELDSKELYLKLSREDNVERRSRLLFQVLENMTRVVFFLDDMWKKISLEEIGIPDPTQKNGFKLILTTRLLDVCRRMGCHEDNTIKVEGLPKNEAWELLMNKIGCVLSPEAEEIAEMVVKKCSGLPLAIITVGGAMRRNSDIDEWRVALDDLNLRDPSNRMMDMEDNVYECLKFSYDRLENEKQRKCFLFCALYPEDWRIATRELVDFWIKDGLVEGKNREDELVKGQYILNKLKGHCLLEAVDEVYDVEYGETLNRVKMHDLIRDMALRLTNKCFMVKNGPDLKELPNEEEWEIDLERASFRVNYIEAVSISPMCPNLSTLIIRGGFLKSVTHDFFVHMKSLKILDLQFSWISDMESLPKSISDLVNLRALRLESMLRKLPSLAKLVLLRTLDLNRTGIEELPEGMDMLVNLRRLNLQEVKLRKKIPIGLISKFSLLEELYLGGIEVDKLYDVGRGKYFAKELLSLKQLENLSVTFHCLSDYVSYVGSPKFNGLKWFFLATGKIFIAHSSRATISLVGSSDEPPAFIILPNTKDLQIEEFHDVKRLNELGWSTKDVEKLVSFEIRDCLNLECIWSSKEFSATATSSTCWLRSVERMDIVECAKLYTIFEGIPISSGIFCLKKLIISSCHNLKKVFPSSRLLQLLQNLEGISIKNCDELEELIGDDEEEETETPITIPRLKKLYFWNLPKLKSIWRGVMICDSLEVISVDGCYKLKSLPQLKGEEQSTPPPALRSIRGDREWWDSLEWDPAYPKNIFQPFYRETSDYCYYEGADYMFSSMLKGEKSSQSDECALEGAGIDRQKTFQLDLNVPVGYVCHNCEMYPIVGKHYTCKDCWEKRTGINAERGIGFDLCEECYTTISKSSDLVNYHHTQGHTLELIADGGDSPVPEVLLRDWFTHSNGEDSLMVEAEKSSQSKECSPEGAGIDRGKTFQLDLNVPVGYVCHNCEMYPKVGKRFRCKDCWEKSIAIIPERGIGFDLCEECYNTPSKHSDLVNHHHMQGHTFELIAHSGDGSIPVNLTLSL